MFDRKSKYYYGDGSTHILELRPSYVDAFLRLEEATSKYTLEQLQKGVSISISRKDLRRADKLIDILNEYLKTHAVWYDDTSKPILRRVR